MRVAANDDFEHVYMQKFRALAAPWGEFVAYERDRAARDIGLHSNPEVDLVEFSWAVPWERERTRRLLGLGFEAGTRPGAEKFVQGRPGAETPPDPSSVAARSDGSRLPGTGFSARGNPESGYPSLYA